MEEEKAGKVKKKKKQVSRKTKKEHRSTTDLYYYFNQSNQSYLFLKLQNKLKLVNHNLYNLIDICSNKVNFAWKIMQIYNVYIFFSSYLLQLVSIFFGTGFLYRKFIYMYNIYIMTTACFHFFFGTGFLYRKFIYMSYIYMCLFLYEFCYNRCKCIISM